MVISEQWRDECRRRQGAAYGCQEVTAIFDKVHVLLKGEPHRRKRGELQDNRYSDCNVQPANVVDWDAHILQWLRDLVQARIAVDVHSKVETGQDRHQRSNL